MKRDVYPCKDRLKNISPKGQFSHEIEVLIDPLGLQLFRQQILVNITRQDVFIVKPACQQIREKDNYEQLPGFDIDIFVQGQ